MPFALATRAIVAFQDPRLPVGRSDRDAGATPGSIPGRLARVLRPSDPTSTPPKAPPPAAREAVQRWRLVVARRPDAPPLAQKQWLEAWEAALAGSGLPIAGMDVPPNRPRFAVAAPLAAAMPSEGELVDVILVRRLPVWRVREALAGRLPEGHELLDLHDVWLGEPALPGRVEASIFRVEVVLQTESLEQVRASAEGMLGAAELPRERVKGDSIVRYDLRPFLGGIEIGEPRDDGVSTIRLRLRHDPERGIGRPDEVLAELGERAGAPLEVRGIVRESLVLRELLPRAPAPPRQAGVGGVRRPRR